LLPYIEQGPLWRATLGAMNISFGPTQTPRISALVSPFLYSLARLIAVQASRSSHIEGERGTGTFIIDISVGKIG
jgi:hypothetical protein